MKKIIIFFISVLLLVVLCISTFATFVQDEIDAKFINNGHTIYLTNPIKTDQVKNDHAIVKDKYGNDIVNDAFIPTDASVVYYNSIEYQVVLMGDVNCDGHVSAADARLVLRISANLEKNLSANAYLAADTRLSGLLPTASDARKILRCSASLDDFSDFEKILTEKREASAELDCRYESVLVLLKPEYVGTDEATDPAFYDADLVKSVEYLKTGSIYILNLNTPSKENVDKLIEKLKGNDAVISAEKDYIFYLY